MDLVYDTALFLHVTGVLVLFAAVGIEGVALGGLRTAVTGEQARTWLGAMRYLRIAGTASGLLILAPGLYMAAASWGGTGWILVGFVVLLLIAVTGAFVTGRRMAMVAPLAARAQGALPLEVRDRLRDPYLLGSLLVRSMLALGVVLVMTVKPDLLVSVLVVLVAAAIGVAMTAVRGGRVGDATAETEARS